MVALGSLISRGAFVVAGAVVTAVVMARFFGYGGA
jgi:hypothetical protein